MDLRAELEKGKRFALPSREKARQLHAAYVRVHLYLSEHSTGYYMHCTTAGGQTASVWWWLG
jgi:hypothetical protein